MSETALYAPVKRFLESHGFTVKGEIRGADVVAVREGTPLRLVIAELKLGLNFDLILQAVDRLHAADEVWLAVPATRRGRDRDRRAHRLCRLLGVGLLAVTVRTGHVEILAEAGPYTPRRNAPKRRLILREFNRRAGDPSEGGSTRAKIMTAYRQQSLAIAAALRPAPLRPRDLRPTAPDAASILQRNVYGWFERIARGVYALSDSGQAALRDWAKHLPTGETHGLPGTDG
jgi:hypothetical protein